jgi:hypothetical protein
MPMLAVAAPCRRDDVLFEQRFYDMLAAEKRRLCVYDQCGYEKANDP